MGLVLPADGLPRPAARARDRAPARCWSSTRSSPAFASRAGGAQELTGVTPDITILGKVIGGGLPAAAYGGSRELMERVAPGRRRLPGGHAEREPARRRRRAGDAAPARRAGLPAPRTRRPRRSPRACARPPATVPGAGQLGAPGLLTVFFSDDARARLRRRRSLRPRRLRRLVPRAAGARRLPAAVAVRGLVPVAGPHAEHVERTLEAAAAAFREVAVSGAGPTRLAAADPRGRRAARRRAAGRRGRGPRRCPAPGAAGRRRAARRRGRERSRCRRGGVRGLPAAPAPVARARAADPDLALLAGDRLYALGLATLGRAGRPGRRARAGRRDLALRAQAQAEGDRDRADALGGRARPRSGGAATPSWRPPRRPRAPALRGAARGAARRRRSSTLTRPARASAPRGPT